MLQAGSPVDYDDHRRRIVRFDGRVEEEALSVSLDAVALRAAFHPPLHFLLRQSYAAHEVGEARV